MSRWNGRKRSQAALVVALLLLSGCGSAATDPEAPPVTEEPGTDEQPVEPTQEPDEPTVEIPAHQQAMLDDAQALCDALDHDEIAGIVGEVTAAWTDDAGPDYSLCGFDGAEGDEIARVWLYVSWDDRTGLRRLANDEYSPCTIGDLEGMCQTDTGNPESPNGWPTAAVQSGAVSIETQTVDPLVAQQLLAAVIDDIDAP